MTSSIAAAIADSYLLTHRRVLTLATTMSNEQLHWRATANSHTCAFHLWHLTRWADHLQAAIPGMTAILTGRLGAGSQIWDAEGLAARWGFDRQDYGFAATGMGMSDDLAREVTFPDKEELLGYMRTVLTAMERAFSAIDDGQFAAAEQWQPLTEGIWGDSSVGVAILSHLIHANRHLGAMECLYGQQTGSGTASV